MLLYTHRCCLELPQAYLRDQDGTPVHNLRNNCRNLPDHTFLLLLVRKFNTFSVTLQSYEQEDKQDLSTALRSPLSGSQTLYAHQHLAYHYPAVAQILRSLFFVL